MKIKYSFVTGETCEIEVEGEWSAMIMTFEHESSMTDRAETRRHTSIEALAELGTELADPAACVDAWIDTIEVKDTLTSLLPDQQRIIQKIFFEGYTASDIACEEGVTESAIRDRLRRIYKKLKIFLE